MWCESIKITRFLRDDAQGSGMHGAMKSRMILSKQQDTKARLMGPLKNALGGMAW